MTEVLGTEFIPHSLFPCATRRGVGREFRSEVEPGKKGGKWRKWVPDSGQGLNLAAVCVLLAQGGGADLNQKYHYHWKALEGKILHHFFKRNDEAGRKLLLKIPAGLRLGADLSPASLEHFI